MRFHLGNINPCHIVHAPCAMFLIMDLSFGTQPSYYHRSILFDDADTPIWRLNLHKSDAVNERLTDELMGGRCGSWSNTSGQDSRFNSSDNNAENDTAGCYAIRRKSM